MARSMPRLEPPASPPWLLLQSRWNPVHPVAGCAEEAENSDQQAVHGCSQAELSEHPPQTGWRPTMSNPAEDPHGGESPQHGCSPQGVDDVTIPLRSLL